MKEDFTEKYPISQKIMRFIGEAIRDYSMIGPGDRIMIGLSGGKDSLILSLALAVLRRRSPVKFGLSACLIDQTGGSMETAKVKEFMEELEIPLLLINHPTFSIMEEREERSPCSLCSNMRRGILAGRAREAGANVLALGHHKDDAVETVLLNLFYGGRFKCWQPTMFMSRTEIRVIRPLAYIEERRISLEAARLGLPVTSSCCPYSSDTKRLSAKNLLKEMEKEMPELKSNVIHALRNVKGNDVWW
ncbi:MAG TPA: ATP-binding protein [Synergistaceae bacterium]|jgi:tRNA 2-thiocytidine biosynthesis protein TtcA|nr:ATP-binding protein [Synergistaceae bacterium]HQA54684.1 ATP-binding protein [Synergistaceae bacterium]